MKGLIIFFFALLFFAMTACAESQRTLPPAATPSPFSSATPPPIFTESQFLATATQPPPPLTLTSTPSATLVPPTATSTPQSLALNDLYWMDEKVGWGRIRNPWRVVRTEDGGVSWQDVTPDALLTVVSRFTTVFFLDSQNGWIILPEPLLDGTSMFRTQNGGQEWIASLTNIPFGEVVTLHFWDTQNGWSYSHGGCGAGNCGGWLSRTADGGESWTIIKPTEDEELPYFSVEDDSTIFYVGGLRFWLNSPSTIWVGGQPGPYDWIFGWNAWFQVSRDDGKTWEKWLVPMPGEAPEAGSPIETHPPVFLNQNEAYFVALYTQPESDGSRHAYMAFFYSGDGGSSWLARPSVVRTSYTDVFDIVSVDDIFVLCAESLCVSHDGGITWQIVSFNLQFNPDEARIDSLDFVSSTTGWVVIRQLDDDQRLLYQTTDGGSTWNLLQPVIGLKP